MTRFFKRKKQDDPTSGELADAINKTDVPLADREKLRDRTVDHADYSVLKSCLESLIGIVNDFTGTEFQDVGFDQISDYLNKEESLYPPALMMLVSDLLTSAPIHSQPTEGKPPLDLDEAQMWLIESGYAKELSKAMHLSFLTGVLYHQRNTSLVADLLMNQEDEEKNRASLETSIGNQA